MNARDVATHSGPVRLTGSLVRPDWARPDIVLMVHGSGPLDRDENVGAQKLNVFNTLAADLHAAGFASLRYDKRGCGASGGDYLRHGYPDLVADVRAWLDFIGRTRAFGRVHVLGHSEGTLIAPMAAAGRDDVAGLILLCPFVTPGQAILRAQAEEAARMLREMKGPAGWLSRRFAALVGGPERLQARLLARITASREPTLRLGLRRIGARALRDFIEADAAAVHAANRLPTLIVTAGKDVQCPPGDGPAIAALSPRARNVTLPDLTHLLRSDPGPPGFSAYPRLMHQALDPEVGRQVVAWLRRQRSGPQGQDQQDPAPDDAEAKKRDQPVVNE